MLQLHNTYSHYVNHNQSHPQIIIKNIVTHKGSYLGYFDLSGNPSMLVRQKLHTTGVPDFELGRRNHCREKDNSIITSAEVNKS